jgi:hypothetical protein
MERSAEEAKARSERSITISDSDRRVDQRGRCRSVKEARTNESCPSSDSPIVLVVVFRPRLGVGCQNGRGLNEECNPREVRLYEPNEKQPRTKDDDVDEDDGDGDDGGMLGVEAEYPLQLE